MLSRTLAALVFTASLAMPVFAATEVAGVKFEDKASLGGSELILNGAGLRTKLLFKVYAIGLYLPAKTDTVANILASRGNKRIQIVMLRDLSAEQLVEALEKGVGNSNSADEQAKIKTRLDEFRASLLAMEKIPEKTDVRIEWNGSATQVFINGIQKGKDIPGEDFYQALLKIWLGSKPAQADLKDALLGNIK
ncbi:MAG: chalcone isomerase family protein [Betaproteobacteria bacterium]|nr:chalcone isomerase family protein [Betaproteobacteria bacterium]